MNSVIKTMLVVGFCTTAVSVSAQSSLEEKYTKSCKACHASGAAGAPKTGDAQAWASRMDKGPEVLLASVKNGLKAMPPKGLCFDCTDEEFVALIQLMATPAE